jgi:nucleoid DNA-binding protein
LITIVDEKMTNLVFSIIKYKVMRMEEVKISGFGTFYLKDGEIAFKAGYKLKDALNPPMEWEDFIKIKKKEYKEGRVRV